MASIDEVLKSLGNLIWGPKLFSFFCLKATEYGLVISDPRGCDNYPDTGGRRHG